MMLNILVWMLLPLLSQATDLTPPLAKSLHDDQIISRVTYDLSYNDEHEVANWVGHTIGTKELRNCVQRSDAFRVDPLVKNGSSTPADYANSGYDRGHLLPAGDMKFDATAMKDTFYMSNMTPQPPKFNRGRWSVLENLARAWGLKYKKIWIVSGPILKENLPKIGVKNQVSVPADYFKVILRQDGQSFKGIGFLMSTEVPYTGLTPYALPINQIEDLSGVDFFPTLEDTVEEEIESELKLDDWDFTAQFSYLPC